MCCPLGRREKERVHTAGVAPFRAGGDAGGRPRMGSRVVAIQGAEVAATRGVLSVVLKMSKLSAPRGGVCRTLQRKGRRTQDTEVQCFRTLGASGVTLKHIPQPCRAPRAWGPARSPLPGLTGILAVSGGAVRGPEARAFFPASVSRGVLRLTGHASERSLSHSQSAGAACCVLYSRHSLGFSSALMQQKEALRHLRQVDRGPVGHRPGCV